jgi:hypothetical protein
LPQAVNRFNASYAKESSEDRIIDLTIALESSLLYESRGELAYKLSLRGATILRETFDVHETFRFLGKLYRYRSKIVHGGHKKLFGNWKDARDFADKAEEYTRLILRSLLLHEEDDLVRLITIVNKQILDGICGLPRSGLNVD